MRKRNGGFATSRFPEKGEQRESETFDGERATGMESHGGDTSSGQESSYEGEGDREVI